MCGIAGYYSLTSSISGPAFNASLREISHRGPDDEGYAYEVSGTIYSAFGDATVVEMQRGHHINTVEKSRLYLGHRRLAILDLSPMGHQPMNLDSLSMVYNGEIFNYIEIREELISLGYQFESESDSEVFLKAYKNWGDAAFNKFNGMWAAAIFDSNDGSLTIVRDRFGIKPLFYFYDAKAKTLIFSSEIKALINFIPERILNRDVAYDYLRRSWLEHTNHTFFTGVMSLEAGCKAVFKQEFSVQRYYTPKSLSGSLKNILVESIDIRTRSDAEIGVLLSGGIDSSLIAAISAAGHGQLKSFTADFEDNRFSERNYVKDNISAHGLDPHFIMPDPQKIDEDLDDFLLTHETPVRSLSAYSQYTLYQHISKTTDVKVILSGQGADEIFSGYTNDYYRYLASVLLSMRIFKGWRILNEISAFTRLSKTNLLIGMLRQIASGIYSKEDPYQVFSNGVSGSKLVKKSKGSFFKTKQFESIFTSPLPEYLRDEDRNSMRFSIEARLPFMDYRLIELGLSLEEDEMISNGRTKSLVRALAKEYIPSSILNRTDKMGFVSPQEVWQKGELKTLFDAAFEDIRYNGIYGMVDGEKVFQRYQEYLDDRFADWAFIWRCFCLKRFCDVWGLKE